MNPLEQTATSYLQGRDTAVTGGNRRPGPAIVAALVTRRSRVTAVTRKPERPGPIGGPCRGRTPAIQPTPRTALWPVGGPT